MAESYWDHIEPFWEEINIYDGPEIFLRQFAEIPEHAGHLFAAHWCISEVCNGGFHQFFYNSTGVLAPEAVEGFKAIGLPETAAVIAEAMARLPAPYPRDRDIRQNALDALDPEEEDEDDWESPFDDLDTKFYDLYDTENGGMAAADRYAAQFDIPEGLPRKSGLLGRLLGLFGKK
jgi:hypothetical protein